MENRKPFKLRGLIVVYNFLQILLSIYIFWEVSAAGWLRDYNWRCQPVDFSRSEMAMRVRKTEITIIILQYNEWLFIDGSCLLVVLFQ